MPRLLRKLLNVTQITFAEELQGQQHNERSYNQPLIAVGRNPATCQIVFDQKQWPTVSRQHAEFRLQNGRWLVSDSGSTYGTFLDGQQLKEPTAIHVNSRIQFGSGGPVLVVIRIGQETPATETLVDSPRQAPPSSSTPSLPSAAQSGRWSTSTQVCRACLCRAVGSGTGHLQRIELSKEVIASPRPWSGGGNRCCAAIVSRRHAEIRRQTVGTFWLTWEALTDAA